MLQKNYTYQNLRGMTQNKGIAVAKNDKDSSVTELDTMIDDGIMKCTYVETTHNTLKEL